jgi:hypothetical protein
MNFNPAWLFNPITICATAGTVSLALLYLWCSARMEIGRYRKDISSIRESTQNDMRELTVRMDELCSRPVPESVPQAIEIRTVGESINLTRRARALQMHRRGDELHTIAAAVGSSHGELSLLLKIDRLIQKSTK